MSQVTLLIVEDEMIIANDMKLMLEAVGYSVAGIARSLEKALVLLEQGRPDLVLIDINLGKGLEGVEVGRVMREKYHLPFIFCTSYSDKRTVTEAARVRPNGYLLKPFTKDDLFVAIEVALTNASAPESGHGFLQDSIFVKEGKLFIKIAFNDILYVEQDRNYVEIHTLQRKFPLRSPLKEFIRNLPADKFLQVHRSFIVNVAGITAINNDTIRIKDHEIPISRTFRDELLAKVKLLS